MIRRHKPDALIVIGTPNYAREIQYPAEDPLPFDNVMYSFHFYATSHTYVFRAKLRNVMKRGTPIFITESGLCEESGDGKIDFENVRIWYSLIDSLHISYTIWNLSNKEEESSMIRDDSRAVEYLTDGDLTISGRFAKALFQGTPIDKITLEYSTIENFKILARSKPHKVWLMFAGPLFIFLFLCLALEKYRKRSKNKIIRSYDDLLKY